MSTRRHRSRPKVAIIVRPASRGVLVPAPPLRRTREIELADLTASESARRHLEEARPLLELAVTVDRQYGGMYVPARPAIAAAVRIAGPCPAGWCRYPAGHSGDHEPLEAA